MAFSTKHATKNTKKGKTILKLEIPIKLINNLGKRGIFLHYISL